MMRNGLRAGFALAALGAGVLGAGMVQSPPAGPGTGMTAVAATSRAALSEWDQKISALAGRGDLLVLTTSEDTRLPGRTHNLCEQLY